MKRMYSLYDRLLSIRSLSEAFKKVKRAKGAGGIDGQSIADFAENEEENLLILLEELRSKKYRPLPVRRKVISKEGGGERLLGIPAIRDRIVQQALLTILQPVFEPHFHPSSYAYRPGRGCHDALSKVTMFVRDYHLAWAVDLDLSKCFDTLDHELILNSFRKRIADGSILNLLRMFLGSGVMIDGVVHESDTGSPQGGVISPFIANVYLDSFDQEMKRRGHRIVRYADDILVLKHSKSGAENAFAVVRTYLENRLKLKVNEAKSCIVHAREGIPYLGVIILPGFTRIQDKKIRRFKEKVKRITRKNSPVNLDRVIKELSPVLRGFANYFRVANCNGVFKGLMGWIRRRLRAKQLALWKKPKRLHRRLRQLGYRGKFKKIAMTRWHNSASPLASYAVPTKELHSRGLFDMSSIKTGLLPPPLRG